MPAAARPAVRVYSREDLEHDPTCACGGLHPHRMVQNCHPEDGLRAMYHGGVVSLLCNRCGVPVLAFRVGARLQVN